jgi:bifunctional UDP-N-acetylglucosamine pyrophosphorylase/glucosamine-1-phosphate N-acetyltransferase
VALADALDTTQTVVVLAHDTIEPVRQRLGERYGYVVQHERFGTGHAVLQALPLLAGQSNQVLVLFGDTPLLQVQTAQAVIALRQRTQALLGLMSFRPTQPSGYGRVVRNDTGHVVALVEERDATPEQRLLNECNSGIMCIDANWLWAMLPQIPRSPLKGEYYLTDLVAMAVAQRGPGAVVALEVADEREAWGINDRVQLAQAELVLRERIVNELMRSGVTVVDPRTTYVDVGVTVGRDTTLLPGTLLQGATQVGPDCVIGPHTTLIDAAVGAGARVRHILAEGVTIDAGADLEPFTYLTGERRATK